MKPYGAEFSSSPPHIKRGGSPHGYFDTWKSFCRCCNGHYCKLPRKKIPKNLKKRARRYNKKLGDDYD